MDKGTQFIAELAIKLIKFDNILVFFKVMLMRGMGNNWKVRFKKKLGSSVVDYM